MAEVNPTETVSKTEFDRVQTEAKEAKSGLEAVRNQLLSTDYLDFLAAKNGTKPAAPVAGALPVSVSGMSLAELTAFIDKRTIELVNPAITNIQTVLKDVQVKQELEEVQGRHEDFETYRPKVVEILTNSTNDLTIEQAYLMAKASAPAAPAKEAGKAPATPTSEKPGGTLPVDGDSMKKFKNATDAGTQAWAEVAAKHGISGDHI